jgi:hypothetical protein
LNTDAVTADAFYQYFRCGLLHEAHIKQFGQFSFDPVFNEPIQLMQDYVVVNPEKLYFSLQNFFQKFMDAASREKAVLNILINRLKDDFAEEVKLAL